MDKTLPRFPLFQYNPYGSEFIRRSSRGSTHLCWPYSQWRRPPGYPGVSSRITEIKITDEGIREQRVVTSDRASGHVPARGGDFGPDAIGERAVINSPPCGVDFCRAGKPNLCSFDQNVNKPCGEGIHCMLSTRLGRAVCLLR